MLCIGFNVQLYCMKKAKEEAVSLFDLCKKEGEVKVKLCLESISEKTKKYMDESEVDKLSKEEKPASVNQVKDEHSLIPISAKIICELLKKSEVKKNIGNNEVEITVNVDSLLDLLWDFYTEGFEGGKKIGILGLESFEDIMEVAKLYSDDHKE
jgi:hypothetical protein